MHVHVDQPEGKALSLLIEMTAGQVPRLPSSSKWVAEPYLIFVTFFTPTYFEA